MTGGHPGRAVTDDGTKRIAMRHYIALIHKDDTSCFGVSFPDVRGVFTTGETLDAAYEQAREVLEFAAGDWAEDTGTPFPQPRTIDALRRDPEFRERSVGAILMAVPFDPAPSRIAAE